MIDGFQFHHCVHSFQQHLITGCALAVIHDPGHNDNLWLDHMLGKDLGRASWSALGSTLRPGSAKAGSLDVASGSEEEARGEAGVAKGTRAGAGDEVGQAAVASVFF